MGCEARAKIAGTLEPQTAVPSTAARMRSSRRDSMECLREPNLFLRFAVKEMNIFARHLRKENTSEHRQTPVLSPVPSSKHVPISMICDHADQTGNITNLRRHLTWSLHQGFLSSA